MHENILIITKEWQAQYYVRKLFACFIIIKNVIYHFKDRKIQLSFLCIAAII